MVLLCLAIISCSLYQLVYHEHAYIYIYTINAISTYLLYHPGILWLHLTIECCLIIMYSYMHIIPLPSLLQGCQPISIVSSLVYCDLYYCS